MVEESVSSSARAWRGYALRVAQNPARRPQLKSMRRVGSVWLAFLFVPCFLTLRERERNERPRSQPYLVYPCFCLFLMLMLHESPLQQQHPSFDGFCFESCFVWFDIEHESPLQQHDGIEQHDSVFFGWSAGLVVCAPTIEKAAVNASMSPRVSPRMFFILSS